MEQHTHHSGGTHHHHSHRSQHEHIDSAERYKRRTLSSSRMRKKFAKGLFNALCVLALLLLAYVVYIYSN